MGKKGGGRGRDRNPRQRILRVVPERVEQSAEDQQLFQSLRTGLRSNDPLDLLATVSGLLTVTDTRIADPFERREVASLGDLVDSFIGTPFAETTAVLAVIHALTVDEVMAARIAKELAQRRHPLPSWIAHLGDAEIESEVWFLTHTLGDGDDYFIGISLAGGHHLTAVVYVDHNMGTVVKDAFVVPDRLDTVRQHLSERLLDDDQSLTSIDPATARAVMEEAIDHGARVYPPLESDSWPMCRPVVEWLLRKLPAGGAVPRPPEWTPEEQIGLADAFFASRFGSGLDTSERRDLLDSLMWFGTDYGPGDPLRWSPVNVEIVLADWFPRKIVADVAYLTQFPDLLRAFIRYAHDRQGVRESLTTETLQAVDRWEPEYQLQIRSDRPRGAAALAASLVDGRLDLDDDSPYADFVLEELAGVVGGRTQLMNLTPDPLPDEAFIWAGIAEDIRPVVEKVLASCDQCAEELLDVEHRTAMRRFLARAAAVDPGIFRRRGSPVRRAAAVAWVICRANRTAGPYERLEVQELLAWFGVKGSASQNAEPLLRANQISPYQGYEGFAPGTPDLLVARRRAEIIKVRDQWLATESD